ncbi:putative membrane protein YqjE [Paraburkholderia caledonica]|uniref:Membrane protein YqjE n=1 Tax=Paraburkholderia caledonica TaxID=134536 RepID=A0ABU1L4J3_9BURK|nr:putative membrane protein YqjE [Paraburkholderia caledonica]
MDYAELLALELEEAKGRLVREVIAMVVLAVAAMFTLSFLCVAIIVTAWNTPYVISVAWGVAAAWLVISIATFAMMKAQKPVEPLHVLRDEVSHDLEALKDALK